jgi:hypothetical protein
VVALAGSHLHHDHAAVRSGILGDLPGRGLQRPLEEAQPRAFISVTVRFFALDGVDGPQQG